jgi:hypothetical protein
MKPGFPEQGKSAKFPLAVAAKKYAALLSSLHPARLARGPA